MFTSAAEKENSKLSSENSTAKRKSSGLISLEQRIFTTSGPVVFLAPLSISRHANADTFKSACLNLQSKNLGEYNKFSPNENSNRKASGFKKAISKPDQILYFTNALADFNCTYAEYEKTLSEDNILPPSTPNREKPPISTVKTALTKSVLKRSVGSTSIQNITHDSQAKSSETNEAESFDSDSSSNE